MSIVFDKLQFQNDTHFGGEEPIVAEIGVEVTTIPTDVYSEEEGWSSEDVPLNVDPGYYYVAVISKLMPVGGVKMEDWGKRYLVSRESIYEYIYGFADENEPPEYIESYDRIADAAESDFLNYFLLINRLIDESRRDQAELIKERRGIRLKSDVETTIQIEQVDRIAIISRAITDDEEQREARCEIILDDERGSCILLGQQLHIFPQCWFVVGERKEKKEEHFTLERAYDTRYFSCFVELEKTTKERVSAYFDQEASSLEDRFAKEEIAALKTGILGAALGIKEYQ